MFCFPLYLLNRVIASSTLVGINSKKRFFAWKINFVKGDKMKKIKIFFYTLFILDILASIVMAFSVNITAGIATAVVLLLLNITVYVIILKADKARRHGTK
jgi:hypothetical protein